MRREGKPVEATQRKLTLTLNRTVLRVLDEDTLHQARGGRAATSSKGGGDLA